MKRVLTVLVASMAGVVLVPATSSSAARPRTTLDVFVAAGEPIHVDELEPGLGPGDWLLFRDPVLDATGEEIGTATTRVQVIAPTDDGDIAFILDYTVELGDGRLVFTGAELFTHLETGVSYAVVGGTGSYARARGQVTGEPGIVEGRPASHMTFELAKK